jgi:ABC-type sugar transport system ATPase subunit
MGRSIIENVTLASLGSVSRASIISRRGERQRAQAIVDSVDVRTASARLLVDALSGGNQQKVLFAKWLFRDPKVLLADEPTRGVDVGAKRAIYTLLHDLAASGTAVIMISSELEEVIGLAHRVLVFRLGRVVAEFDGESVTEQDVLSAVFQTDGDDVFAPDGAESDAPAQARPPVGMV